MKHRYSFVLLSICSFLVQSLRATPGQLDFVENKKQWPEQIQFKTDIPGGHIFFTRDRFRFSFYDLADLESIHEKRHEDYGAAYNMPVDCYAYDVVFVNSNTSPVFKREGEKSYYHNYFLGNDRSKWAGHVGVFDGITYQNLYPGIDLKAYSVGTSFKYDLVVAPGQDVSTIQFRYEGITPSLNEDGSIRLFLGFNTVQEAKPFCYQVIDGQRNEVKSRYVLKNGMLSFEFPKGYNKNYPLVIDPTLIFATYSSGTCTTYGFSATYDIAGHLYAGGECFGTGWPGSVGAFQLVFAGGVDAGINKYTPTGNALLYSTYYGGSGYDVPNNLVVNAAGELAVTGSTSSSNLPVTVGAYDNTLGGTTDAYVVRFNATATALLGATYVGGSQSDAQNTWNLSPNYGDGNRGEIYYDGNSDVVVAVSTQSSDFPTTPGAYQTTFGGGTQDGCFFKLDGTCSNLIFSTFLGGSGDDACFAVVKNSLGEWLLTGGTASNNFPTSGGGYQIINSGGTSDAFVTKLDNSASLLIHSTYLGTSDYDHGFKIQVDPNDTVYVCGQTEGATFPVSPGVYNNAGGNIFITKLTPNLNSVALSTRIGLASNPLVPTAFLKDNCGNVYFSGFQAQAGLPLTPNAFQSTVGGFWLAVLSGDLTSLVYATYMGVMGDHVDGGTSRFDPQGIVYQSVCTSSGAQYQSPGCLSPNNQAGSWDVASFKFDFELAGVNAALVISPNDSGCAPFTVNFTNNSIAGVNYLWDFGDGGTSTLTNPTHTYLTAGSFTVRLVAYNPNGCVESDTAFTTIRVIEDVDASFITQKVLNCIDDTVHFTLNANPIPANVTYAWNFGDGTIGNSVNPTHIYTTQNTYTITCIATNGFCRDTFQAPVNLLHPIDAQFATLLHNPPDADFAKDSFCLGDVIKFDAVLSVPQGYLNYFWDMGDGNTLNMTANSHNYTYAKSGVFTIKLVVTDTLSCVDSIQRNIYVDEKGYASFSILDDTLCVGEPLFLRDSLVGLTDHFTWNFGDGSNPLYDIHNPVYTYSHGQTYTVTLTAEYRVCPDQSTSKNVYVYDYPLIHLGADTSICPGLTGAIELSDPDKVNANTLLWSTGETSSSILVTQPGYYWVKAWNGSCVTTDSIWIRRDCYLNIPNAFSPNTDGLNDYFLPRELLSSGLTFFRMSIYNRWGEQIFYTTSLDGRGWDGKYDGKDQPQGVYVYVIDAVFANSMKKTFKGNVTLMR